MKKYTITYKYEPENRSLRWGWTLKDEQGLRIAGNWAETKFGARWAARSKARQHARKLRRETKHKQGYVETLNIGAKRNPWPIRILSRLLPPKRGQ